MMEPYRIKYVAEVLTGIAKRPESGPGYRIVQSPPILRHFNSTMEPVPLTELALGLDGQLSDRSHQVG